MVYDKEQVLSYLPHRSPFLFIDRVDSIHIPNPPQEGPYYTFKELNGGHVVASFNVTEDLEVLSGHFPGKPILPGVIQIEMMAQSSSFLITKTFDDINKINFEVALLGADNCRFRRPIVPNMQLELHATQVRSRGTILTYDCQIKHAGELMSQASVMALVKITPKE